PKREPGAARKRDRSRVVSAPVGRFLDRLAPVLASLIDPAAQGMAFGARAWILLAEGRVVASGGAPAPWLAAPDLRRRAAERARAFEARWLWADAARLRPVSTRLSPEGLRIADLSGDGGAPPPLTRRELQVCAFLPVGASNAAIARALKITPRTVNAHVASILAKLNASARAAAAARVVETGWRLL
ncbi:MAG: helix-turn-helix transcriptional regulator, partial [Pseudomonadota bacterium]